MNKQTEDFEVGDLLCGKRVCLFSVSLFLLVNRSKEGGFGYFIIGNLNDPHLFSYYPHYRFTKDMYEKV